METVLEKPTQREQKIAEEMLPSFASAIAKEESDVVKILIQDTSEMFVLPKRALEFLSEVLSAMAEGKAVSLTYSESEISTQQAADILNVSRPHIVKLLEQGLIPFKKIGSHRRILLEDLLTYVKEHENLRKERLQFLADQAQTLNLGYE